MKWAWLLLSLVAVVSAIEHDDLRKLMLGYIQGLEITEDLYELIHCIEDNLGTRWDKSIEEMKKVKEWTDKPQTLLAFVAFIDPAFASLADMIPCSKGEIGKISEQFRNWAQHPDNLVKQAMENVDIIADSLRDVLANLEKEGGADYVEAGNVAGALVHWVFLKQ